MKKKDDEVSVQTTDTPTDIENVKTLDEIIAEFKDFKEIALALSDSAFDDCMEAFVNDLTDLRESSIAAGVMSCGELVKKTL